MKNNIDVILTDIGGVIYKSTGIGIAVSNFLNLRNSFLGNIVYYNVFTVIGAA